MVWAERTKIDYSQINKDYDQPAPSEEAELFAAHGRGVGDSLAALELDVHTESKERFEPARSFAEMGLHPDVVKNILKCGYTKPTAIQAYCIPGVMLGKDLVAVAQTGSGKTAAYLAPIISSFIDTVTKIGGARVDTKAPNYNPDQDKVRAEPLAIIICPTRELALQIHQEALRLSWQSNVRCVAAYGGIPMKMQLQRLGKGADILVGTPGRLKDILERPQIISMRRAKFTVIDEADSMLLDNDFQQDLEKIMTSGDSNEDAGHQYLLFSATFPKAARNLARDYLQSDFIRVRVGRVGSTHKNVKQTIIWTDDHAKQDALYDLLQSEPPDLTLIFCNSVQMVDRLDDFLFNKGLPTVFMHRMRSQYEREDALRDFESRKTPILITTAITARGIDFAAVARVVNYDLPSFEHGGVDEYIHRIGRTGRIGHKGEAISFYNSRNEDIAQGLVNVLMETEQDVPDFLEHLKPEGGKIDFDDDSDHDKEDGAEDAADDGWGEPAADDASGATDDAAATVSGAKDSAPAAVAPLAASAWAAAEDVAW